MTAADPTPPNNPPTVGPPLPSRMFEFAAGLDCPTPEEAAWLDANPRWQDHLTSMKDALAADVRPRPEPDRRTLDFDAESSRVLGLAKPLAPGTVRACLRDAKDPTGSTLLQIFGSKSDGTTDIRLSAPDPQRKMLLVGGTALELVTGFNKNGYATVRTADVDTLLRTQSPVDVVDRE